MKPEIHITYLGGPTALIEIGSVRLLTDPTFDPAGTQYQIAKELRTKLTDPVLPASEVGSVDAVLLSHDHHYDNLDHAGREYLPNAGVVLTTVSGEGRLGANAKGLANWEQYTLTGKQGEQLTITAVPAHHGPEELLPKVGDVVGFVIEGGARTIYVSGDTVYFAGLEEIAQRFQIDLAVIYLGSARSVNFHDTTLTFTAAEGARMANALGKPLVVPIHYEGWSHYSERRQEIAPTFEAAGLAEQLILLPAGKRWRF